jgi:hypothetical protein
VAGNEHKRESTTHAEANHANLANALWMTSEPRATRLDILKRWAGPGNKIPGDGSNATQDSAQVIEINGKRKETSFGKPVSLIAVVFAHASNVVQYDDPRVLGTCRRLGEIAPHLPARRRNEYISHQIASFVLCATTAVMEFTGVVRSLLGGISGCFNRVLMGSN